MSERQRLDAAYGRRGGHIQTGKPRDLANAPRCEECGGAMTVGQKRRHHLCSPLMECCDAHTDLIPDKKAHAKLHAEAER